MPVYQQTCSSSLAPPYSGDPAGAHAAARPNKIARFPHTRNRAKRSLDQWAWQLQRQALQQAVENYLCGHRGVKNSLLGVIIDQATRTDRGRAG